ncbi:hypothetical protein [Anabaena sp. AL93]|uniref:hypothetical protein n=1 Tax=Anabaena sp. AL93 TaxID=1678133 RepID=UPI0025BC3E5F|nr:hypothetical protein [Anabaena sp. AL93]
MTTKDNSSELLAAALTRPLSSQIIVDKPRAIAQTSHTNLYLPFLKILLIAIASAVRH